MAKAARAAKVAGLKLAHVVENTDPLPKKAPVLLEFSRRFLEWLENKRVMEIASKPGSNADKIELIGKEMFGEDW